MAVKASATITLSFMVDVSAVYRYYKLQASTASAPSVPVIFPPSSDWTDAEPNYTTGSTNTLYTVDCTVFANSTFAYSAVSKSSSYEAAKEAYNKALAAESAATDAAKTATNYVAYLNGQLIISDFTEGNNIHLGAATWGDMNTLSWEELNTIIPDASDIGKNLLLDYSGLKIRSGESILASFLASGIEFDQAVTFKADGLLVDNGDAFTYLGRNTVLWSGGPDGYWMNASQSITLSANITRQISGAVFAWSLYQNNACVNSDWHFCFVPKYQVVNFGGNIVRMYDAYLGMNKVLYVSNGNVTGHAQNSTSGTTNGIAWDNSKWALRYVVGV